jgi:uncharacterized membrane protein YkvA (DUF1232 family)
MARSFGERIVRGRLFERLTKRALGYLKDPDKLRELISVARRKATGAGQRSPLGSIWEPLLRVFRLLRAYVRREYTNVPWQTLVVIIAGILYFVLPIDVIPDFIVGAGLLDDVAVLTWVLNSVRPVLDDFGEWEAARAQRIE